MLELQSHVWIKISPRGEVKLDIIGNNEIPTDDAPKPHPQQTIQPGHDDYRSTLVHGRHHEQ